MRLLVALLLVASVLHTQLAVGCHCHHEAGDASAHTGCQHGDLFDRHDDHSDHIGHGSHNGLFGATCDHDHPLPAPKPCDGCAECEQGDPVGLRMEASFDCAEAALLVTWTASAPIESSQCFCCRLLDKQATVPDGVRLLLACGTLLRI
jgi:hypothetical protein